MGYKLLMIPFMVMVLLFALSMSKEASTMGALQITSPAFQNNGTILRQYTCDGQDINPPLMIANCPQGTKSIALICDDPDAPVGTWVHWVIWNIDPGVKEIKENTVPQGAVQGINDFRKHSYGGPCPPSGTHRYYHRLYALDVPRLEGATDKRAFYQLVERHKLAEATLLGTYRRSRW